jgi:hypothetical protein
MADVATTCVLCGTKGTVEGPPGMVHKTILCETCRENPPKQYGVCKALDQQPIEGTDLKLEANPACVCPTPMHAMFCSFGHMLECHYPMTCTEAQCNHLDRYQEF